MNAGIVWGLPLVQPTHWENQGPGNLTCPGKFSLGAVVSLHPLITCLPDQHTFHTKMWLPLSISSFTFFSQLEKNTYDSTRVQSRDGCFSFLLYNLIIEGGNWITYLCGGRCGRSVVLFCRLICAVLHLQEGLGPRDCRPRCIPILIPKWTWIDLM